MPVTPKPSAAILAEAMERYRRDRLFGEVTAVFRDGEVVLVKTYETISTTDGRTDNGRRNLPT